MPSFLPPRLVRKNEPRPATASRVPDTQHCGSQGPKGRSYGPVPQTVTHFPSQPCDGGVPPPWSLRGAPLIYPGGPASVTPSRPGLPRHRAGGVSSRATRRPRASRPCARAGMHTTDVRVGVCARARVAKGQRGEYVSTRGGHVQDAAADTRSCGEPASGFSLAAPVPSCACPMT